MTHGMSLLIRQSTTKDRLTTHGMSLLTRQSTTKEILSLSELILMKMGGKYPEGEAPPEQAYRYVKSAKNAPSSPYPWIYQERD